MSGITRTPRPKALAMFRIVIVDNVVKENRYLSLLHPSEPVRPAILTVLLAKFPPRSKLVSARLHGASFRTRTVRIHVKLSDGTPHRYFRKVATGPWAWAC